LFQLFDARCMLKLCLTKLEELDSLQVDLQINYHDLSPSCWRKKWDHIKKVQVGKEFFPLGDLCIGGFELIALAMIHCNCNN